MANTRGVGSGRAEVDSASHSQTSTHTAAEGSNELGLHTIYRVQRKAESQRGLLRKHSLHTEGKRGAEEGNVNQCLMQKPPVGECG